MTDTTTPSPEQFCRCDGYHSFIDGKCSTCGYPVGILKVLPVTVNQTPSAFTTWLSRHPCTREELWKIQNMLGDCMPDSALFIAASKAWQEMPREEKLVAASPDEIFYARMCELKTPKKGELRQLFIQLFDDCERLLASTASLNTDEDKENKKLFADAIKKYKEIRGSPDGEPCKPTETRLFTGSDKKPEIPLADTLHIVGTMHRNELTQDDWDQVATAFERLHADHARLIEAVEKKEGVKAFADLHFPPAA